MNAYGSIAPSNDTDKFADNPNPAPLPPAKDHGPVSAVCRMQFRSTSCFSQNLEKAAQNLKVETMEV